MDPVLEFPLRLPAAGSRSLIRSLHEQLRAAIVDGRLKPGAQLPASRALATSLGVSRNTAIAAYDLLVSEGYVVARPKSGAYVADAIPEPRPRRRVAEESMRRRLAPRWREPPAWPVMPAPARYEFRLGIADKRLFPFDVWRRLSARTLRTFAHQLPSYSDPQGRAALRDAIAKHASFARAVACRPEDIVVTSGSQQAFDLIARILVTPGRTRVAVENPGYGALRAALAAHGATLVPIPVDDEGMIVDKLPIDVSAVFVTPSHQFPLGVAMSMRRRAALLDFARRHGAVIVEDDYDGEFRYGGRPLEALQSLDRNETVFYVGTFSKSIFAGMRLGFVVAPPWALSALVAAKRCADIHCAVVEQETLAAFIGEGHMARHVRKLRAVYAGRLDTVLECLRNTFADELDPVASHAGLHVTALARVPLDVGAIAERARTAGVGVYPLRNYYFAGRARPGFAFGYGSITEREIVEAFARLRSAWRA